MKSKDLFPAIFSRHAEAYDRRLDQIMTRGESAGRQRIIALVEARPGMRVLDLACGPGTLSRRLATLVEPNGEVVGVDLAPGMIERARIAEIPNARFAVMDIEQLEFDDSSFDAAVCGHGLQFAPHLDRALSETRRVLRPGSRFAASVPARTSLPSVQDLLDEVFDRHLPPSARPADLSATRHVVAEPEGMQRAARNAGFSSARVESIDEKIVWGSAEQLVAMLSSWWDCAERMDRLDEDGRANLMDDAIDTLRSRHPGAIETGSGNLILFAIA